MVDKWDFITIGKRKLIKLKKKLRLKLRKEIMKQLDLSVYFCLKCNTIHKKFPRENGIVSKIFFNHFNYRKSSRILSNSELFKIDFAKKWKIQAKKEKNRFLEWGLCEPIELNHCD